MTYLEFVGEDSRRKDGEAAKFWEVSASGKNLKIRFGKLGTKGQLTLKEFESKSEALEAMEKLIASKKKKGYKEKKAKTSAVANKTTNAETTKSKKSSGDSNWLVPAKDIDQLFEKKSADRIIALLRLLLDRFETAGSLESFKYLVKCAVENPKATEINPYRNSIEDICNSDEFFKLTKDWKYPGLKFGRTPTKLELDFFNALIELHAIDLGIGAAISKNAALPAPQWLYEVLVSWESLDGDGFEPTFHQDLAMNVNLKSATLQKLWDLHDYSNGGVEALGWAIASNPNCPPKLLAELARSESHVWDGSMYGGHNWGTFGAEENKWHEGFVRYIVATNPNTPATALKWLADPKNGVSQDACECPDQDDVTIWAFEINPEIVKAAKANLKKKK